MSDESFTAEQYDTYAHAFELGIDVDLNTASVMFRQAAQMMREREVGHPIHIVCDWRNADPFPRFIEAETPDGKSVSLPWYDRADGMKDLRLYTAQRTDVPDAKWQELASTLENFMPSCGPGPLWVAGASFAYADVAKTIRAMLAAAPEVTK